MSLPHRIHRLLALLALPLMLAAPPAMAQGKPNDTLRIGVIGPFTGPSADFGQPLLNGVRLAVDEINAVGGYMGRKLELVVHDDQATPDIGRKVSEELMRENTVATIGFCNTGVAAKSLDVFQDHKQPLIIPCATGTPLTTRYKAADSYIFRTSARDAIQAPFVVDDIVRRGWTRVAILHDETPYGVAGASDVEKALAEKGLKPVYVGHFPLGVQDLGDELREARDAGANVIFSYTVGPELATIARTRQALGWKVPQVGPWPLSFPNFIDGSKGAAEGALMAQTFIAEPSNERRAAFLSAYSRKYEGKKIPVPMSAAQGYDSTYLLLYALFGLRDGKLTGPAIKNALENIQRTYYGVVATYEHPFSRDDKDALSANMLVMGLVRNGNVTFAHSEDVRRNLFVQRKQP